MTLPNLVIKIVAGSGTGSQNERAMPAPPSAIKTPVRQKTEANKTRSFIRFAFLIV